MRVMWRVSSWLVLAFISWGGAATAQTAVDEIASRLVGKMVFLRGMWSGGKLAFAADGQPKQVYRTVPFTESGLKISLVKMAGSKLQVEGQRVAMGFGPRGIASFVNDGGKATISIDDGNGDLDKAVDAIFTSDLTSMIPSMPDYWQPYATKYFLPAGIAAREESLTTAIGFAGKLNPAQPLHIAGPIKPPRVLHMRDPGFTDAARHAKFSGIVRIYLWVDEKGLPTHLEILQPAGMGLDEEAIAAIQEYRFSPATLDRRPVKVDLYIDVNFQVVK